MILATLGLVIAGILALGLYFKFVKHQIVTRKWTVHVPHMKQKSLTIMHLSDFHFDVGKEETMNRLMTYILAQAQLIHPDIICLTGDYVNADPLPITRLCFWLPSLRETTRMGIFACLGNHDNYRPNSRSIITEQLEVSGVTVLRNNHCHIKDESVVIVGLEDIWSGFWWRGVEPAMNAALSAADATQPPVTIVLSHNPDTAARLDQFEYDLQLSGHTHGGQICLPSWFSFPPFHPEYNVPVLGVLRLVLNQITAWFPNFHKSLDGCHRYAYVVSNWKWALGLHNISREGRARSKWLYTTTGVGSHYNMRLFCPPELAVITLVKDRPQF